MSTYAKVVADSLNEFGNRLLTFECRSHRFILPEINTHRAFSRNTRSERAVPVAKLIEEVRTNPAMPLHWGKNQPGMQASEELPEDEKEQAKAKWLAAAQGAATHAEGLLSIGLHKQLANRVISPYTWAYSLISATEVDNFFALRCHPDAQPEIQALANAMYEAREASVPRLLRPGEWHLPYITEEDRQLLLTKGFFGKALEDLLRKISVARCARVSYRPFDGNGSIEKELERFEKLAGSVPIHASPLEHQATPDTQDAAGAWLKRHLHGNFTGFIQFRKLIPNENITNYTR